MTEELGSLGETGGSLPEAPSVLASDAPPGDTYGPQQAAQVLGVSARRVGQLAHEGRLEIVQDKPLRVSAQSVHELREERRGKKSDIRATVPPESVADQVKELVALFTAEQRKAIEAGESLLAEVSTQRDELKDENARLKDEIEAERLRVEELRTQLAAKPVRRGLFRRS